MINFFLARLLTFSLEQLGLAITMGLVDVNMTIFGLEIIYIAKILLSVLATILNYFISKFHIFKPKGDMKDENHIDNTSLR